MTPRHDLRHLPAAAYAGTIVAMTTTTSNSRNRSSAVRGHLRFAGHYLEMVVAMLVGMFALGPLWSLVAPGPADRGDTGALIMATNMTLGMALWMRIRRHSWPRIAEMSAAMYLPFVLLLPPYWFGAISGHAVMMAGHIAMFPAMFAAMLWRRAEYYHHHH